VSELEENNIEEEKFQIKDKLLILKQILSGKSKNELTLEEWVSQSSHFAADEQIKDKRIRYKKLKMKDVAWFCEQLTTTQNSGMPLTRSLNMIANMQKNNAIGQASSEIAKLISDGASLSGAMRKREDEFSPFVIALVAAGESSGKLVDALNRAAKALRSRLALKSKIKSAMFYPSAVLVVAATLVTVMLTVIIPKFESIYSQNNAQLPSITQFVINLSHNVPIFLVIVILIIGFFSFLYLEGKKKENIKIKIDALKLSIPVIGDMLKKGANARISGTLAGLMGAGISVPESLAYASETAGNEVYKKNIIEIRKRIADGSTIAGAFARSGLFPELMTNLIRIGEESGDVPKLLDSYTTTAEKELETAADRITSLIEPLMMILIGTIVGGFVLAMYLPIFNMSSAIGN